MKRNCSEFFPDVEVDESADRIVKSVGIGDVKSGRGCRRTGLLSEIHVAGSKRIIRHFEHLTSARLALLSLQGAKHYVDIDVSVCRMPECTWQCADDSETEMSPESQG